ncbi:hypothetical protein N7465_000504 [Penicillium sp. CMV-2018d]|nr:hypothetical protein N7465_000504 [Penicillium sp. CMV-2018d]
MPSMSCQDDNMPIAIIGMGCRFPGGIDSPRALWELCATARNTWSEIPRERFSSEGFYHPRTENLGSFNCKGAHFLDEDVSEFDAAFFNFTADMSNSMDPQLRMLLETVFEALESAGLPLDQIAGSRTSVFAGTCFRDYHDMLMRDTDNLPRHFLSGNMMTMTANRISHFFDLTGPSVSVDTACSTALTALHLACQTLRTREASMAIIGGANLLLDLGTFIGLSNLGLLGPDGKSYSLDARAQGYGRGEGVASLLIKPLCEALADGDPIRAVIRGTGLNQDGKTVTLTSPSQSAQEALIRECYKRAGLDPRDTAYIEAHGTGTITGDTTELSAIGAALGVEGEERGPLLVGSIKANMGHLEAASGMAAVIKAVVMLEAGQVPPHAMIGEPNPRVDFDGLNLKTGHSLKAKIPRTLMEWPVGKAKRVSVSNFGAGGANAHLILDARDAYLPQDIRSQKGGSDRIAMTLCKSDVHTTQERYVFSLSAKDRTSLHAGADALARYLARLDPQSGLQDLEYTLNKRRTKFPWRLSVSASGISELQTSLMQKNLPSIQAARQPRLGFVYTGQGAQWFAMGRELMSRYPVFAASIEEADKVVVKLGASWRLREELSRDKGSSRVSGAAFSFPLTVAIQIALTELLKSWGVRPAATTGHSSGEISAAYAAGALTSNQAITIAYVRGDLTARLIKAGTVRGSMIALGIDKQKAKELVLGLKSGVATVACVNSPSSVTVSGDVEAIEELEHLCKQSQVFNRRLKVEAAYHSHHMELIASDYLSELQRLMGPVKASTLSNVLFASPVSGRIVHFSEELGPAHWVENMVKCVLFDECLQTMISPLQGAGQNSVDMLVEIGPHSALAAPIRQILSMPELRSHGITYASCLLREEDAVKTMHELAATLTSHGYPVTLEHVNFPRGRPPAHVIPDLPTYRWNHKNRYWIESLAAQDLSARVFPRHDLLGSRVEGLSPDNLAWRNTIRTSDLPWLVDHALDSNVVFPGAAFLVMVIEAMRQIAVPRGEGFLLSDIELSRALVIPATSGGQVVQLSLRRVTEQEEENTFEFSVYSRKAALGNWLRHCYGKVKSVRNTKPKSSGVSETQLQGLHSFAMPSFYEHLNKVGPSLGTNFQHLVSMHIRDGHALAAVRVPEISSMMPSPAFSDSWVHPTTFDAILHSTYGAVPVSQMTALGRCIPVSARSIFVSPSIHEVPVGHTLHVEITLTDIHDRGFTASLSVFDPSDRNGRPILQTESLRFQSLGVPVPVEDAASMSPPIFRTIWKPDISCLSASGLQDAVGSTLDDLMARRLKTASVNIMCDLFESLPANHAPPSGSLPGRLLEWMRERCEKADLGKDRIPDPVSRSSLYQEIAAGSTQGKEYLQLARHLGAYLREESDGALLSLVQDSASITKGLDRLREGLSRSLRELRDLVALFTHQYPRARILQVAANDDPDGECTKAVIHGLVGGTEAQIDLLFTGSLVVADRKGAALYQQTQHAEYKDHIEYRKLDLLQDPLSQGYSAASFDLIIICGMSPLANDEELQASITHCAKLLVSSGTLVAVEPRAPSFFGFLPSWYISEYTTGVKFPDKINAWDRTLKQAGFAGVGAVLHHPVEESDATHMIVLARNAEKDSFSLGVSSPAISVVYSSSSKRPPPPDWLSGLVGCLQPIAPAGVTLQLLDAAQFQPRDVCIYIDDVENPTLNNPSEDVFNSLKKVLLHNASTVLWVSSGGAMDATTPTHALHTGLLRTLRLEHQDTTYVALDVDPERPLWTRETTAAIQQVCSMVVGIQPRSKDVEFAERKGQIYVPRLVKDYGQERRYSELNAGQLTEMGKLSVSGPYTRVEARSANLAFCESEDEMIFDHETVEIQPHAFGLSPHPSNSFCPDAFECAGIVTKVGSGASSRFQPGDSVCCLIPSPGSMANRVRVPWQTVVSFPQKLSYELAAAFPVAFLTAYYTLVKVAALKPGDSILIHSGAGHVGQAAIAIAQYYKAKIYVTVGSVEDQEFVARVSKLPSGAILSHRSDSVTFHDRVLQLTDGKGVDVVFGSLTGSLLQASWDCVARFGRLIHIASAKDPQHSDAAFKPSPAKSATYICFDVLQLAMYDGNALSDAFQELVSMIGEGQIQLKIPIRCYSLSNISSAVQEQQRQGNSSKTVIQVDSEAMVPRIKKAQRVRFLAEATYLIAGGLTGIGRRLTIWMAERGAKHLILLSRNATRKSNSELRATLDALGTRYSIRDCDIANEEELRGVVAECLASWPPIKGVIQAAGLLENAMFSNMTHSQWTTAVRPKVHGTVALASVVQNTTTALATATTTDRKLDFFIILSSATGILGRVGQANYTAASTYQDSFAAKMQKDGVPAISIDLGSVAETGMAADNKGALAALERAGFYAHSISQILTMVESVILASPPNAQVVTGISPWHDQEDNLRWRAEPRLHNTRSRKAFSKDNDPRENAVSCSMSPRQRIAVAGTSQEVLEIVIETIVGRVANIFMIPADEINLRKDLADYGVDSLVAVELRNWIATNVCPDVSIFDITQGSDVLQLANTITTKIEGYRQETQSQSPTH